VRVLHLSWEYPPIVYGGLGRHVHALAEAQSAAGHDVVVVTHHPGETDVALDEVVSGVRVVRTPYPPIRQGTDELLAWTSGLDRAMARSAVRLGGTWQPDIVHGHDWVVAQAGATVHATFGVALVATVHATEAGRHQGWLPGELSRAIHERERALTADSRRVITCSQHMRWEVTRLFDLPRAKIDVIPNGIDADGWQASAREIDAARAAYAGTGPLVVVAGRLEWEKGVHTVIEAMPRLRRRLPGARLVIAGRGSQRDELEQLARSTRVARSVTFTGWLADQPLRALLAAADVAVVPSVYEPFGLVALEAAALGTPLVVARTGGLAELVEDGVTGRTFPALDVAALADVVTDVAGHPELARRRARDLRRQVRRTCTWPAAALATLDTYAVAVAEEGAGADPARRKPARRRTTPTGNLLHDV
jgi:glycogen synthase